MMVTLAVLHGSLPGPLVNIYLPPSPFLSPSLSRSNNKSLTLTPLHINVLAGSAGIQFFSNAIYGNLSDLLGRKRFLTLSIFGSLVWLACIALGQTLTTMLIAGVIR
jgi:MFS family permease